MSHQECSIEPCSGQAVNCVEYFPVMEMLLEKIRRSCSASNILKNGDWRDYSAEQVFDAVAGEFDEYREAYVAEELRGRHGQIDELYDVAVTAVKGILRLSHIDRGIDREECRQVANDPPDDLPVLEVR